MVRDSKARLANRSRGSARHGQLLVCNRRGSRTRQGRRVRGTSPIQPEASRTIPTHQGPSTIAAFESCPEPMVTAGVGAGGRSPLLGEGHCSGGAGSTASLNSGATGSTERRRRSTDGTPMGCGADDTNHGPGQDVPDGTRHSSTRITDWRCGRRHDGHPNMSSIVVLAGCHRRAAGRQRVGQVAGMDHLRRVWWDYCRRWRVPRVDEPLRVSCSFLISWRSGQDDPPKKGDAMRRAISGTRPGGAGCR